MRSVRGNKEQTRCLWGGREMGDVCEILTLFKYSNSLINESLVFTYSPSCFSKPVWLSFFWATQCYFSKERKAHFYLRVLVLVNYCIITPLQPKSRCLGACQDYGFNSQGMQLIKCIPWMQRKLLWIKAAVNSARGSIMPALVHYIKSLLKSFKSFMWSRFSFTC